MQQFYPSQSLCHTTRQLSTSKIYIAFFIFSAVFLSTSFCITTDTYDDSFSDIDNITLARTVWLGWNGANFSDSCIGNLSDACPSGAHSVPGSTQFACSMPSGPGDWEDGFNFFQDPLPKYVTVIGLDIEVYGQFYCNLDEPYPAFTFVLNDITLGIVSLPTDVVGCLNCSSCITNQTYHFNVHEINNFQYLYGHYNVIQLRLATNEICLVGANLTIYYKYNNIALLGISPDHGPAAGNTYVLLSGSGFLNWTDLQCRFGDARVPATYISNSSISCVTPGSIQGAVLVQASNNGQTFSQDTVYYTYDGPTPDQGNSFGAMLKKYWYFIVLGVLFFILVVVLIVMAIIKKQRRYDHFHLRESSPLLGSYSGINGDVDPSFNFQDLQFLERIGRGNFGEVYRGLWQGTVVAIKKTKMPSTSTPEESAQLLEDFEKEAKIMRNLRHPNVLQFIGICRIGTDVCIITEFLQRGSLNRLLHDREFDMNWKLKIQIAVDVAKGMNYLHRCNPVIIHRDLKSYNLLVDDNYKVKVCDFGLAKHLSQHEDIGAMTSCGTPAWTAPEVLRNEHYTEKADVYSFGIVLWELVTREEPHHGIPPFQVVFIVGTQGVRPAIPSWCPIEVAQLIKDCWDENPNDRPPFDEILRQLNDIANSSLEA